MSIPVISDRPATGPTRPLDPEAFEQNPELRTPTDKAVAAAKRGAELRRRDQLMNYPCAPGLYKKLAGYSPNGLITSAEFKSYQVEYGNWDRLSADLLKYTPDAARAEFKKHTEALHAGIANGTHTAEDPKDAWDKTDFKADYAARLKQVKLARNLVAERASKIIAPVLLRIADFTDDLADSVEKSEREQYGEFAIPYHESHLCLTIRGCAVKLRQPTWALMPFSSFIEEMILAAGAKLKK